MTSAIARERRRRPWPAAVAAWRAGLVVASTRARRTVAIVGGHPPNGASRARGRRAALAGERHADAPPPVLIGGGDALMAVPAEGIMLDEQQATTGAAARRRRHPRAEHGAQHLSAIKGGWLAARAGGACTALAISDVVGDDPSVIASGPTVADASRFDDALDVLRRFGGDAAYPAAVVARLKQGAAASVPDTPKPGDARIAQTRTTVIGSRRHAMAGAVAAAGALGYHVLRLDDPVVGEARITAVAHLRAVVARAAGLGRPACIVSSGETTVYVTGQGKGGPNQEFALAAAESLAQAGVAAVVASAGTDGIDGPTDAAGALADSTTMARAAAAGLVPSRHLSDNNAYAFFDALGDLIHTGPTGTNVGDLQVILLA